MATQATQSTSSNPDDIRVVANGLAERKRRRALSVVLLLSSILPAAVLAPAAVFIPCIAIFIVLTRKRISVDLLTVLSVAIVFKMAGSAIVAHVTHSVPLKVTGQRSLAFHFPPFSLFGLSEIGQIEANVRSRAHLVNTPDSFIVSYLWWPSPSFPGGLDFSKSDPFTGMDYKMIGNLVYSVGPDLVDQSAAAAYDPSNGTFSSGDIIRRHNQIE